MENDEKLFIKLRDCFTGGYTLPQYCIDNGIKKPLFVSEKKFELFIWEIYVQFCYDKRISAQFSLLDASENKINFSVSAILISLTYKNFSEINLDNFDKIIFLTMNKSFSSDKAIYLDTLTAYFISKTYAEIPLLNFLQHNPKVKLFLTNFPYDTTQYEGWREFNSQLMEYRPMQKLLIDSVNKGIHLPTTFDKLGYTNSQVISLLRTGVHKD